MPMNILVCTLGASWAVAPEVYAFLAPEEFPLFRSHPQSAELDKQRREYGLESPDEIWVCTTLGAKTSESLQQLLDWIGRISDPPLLRVWQADRTDQLATRDECDLLRELLLRAVLNAHDKARGGQVVLSLAGGRKTMSADLQWAGQILGCSALVHVIGKDPLPDWLKNPLAADFQHALSPEQAASIVPVVVGSGLRSELLDVEFDGHGPVDAKRFALPYPQHGRPLIWSLPSGETLQREILAREKAGSQLFGNYVAMLSKSEHHENWRSLYRLPPKIIETLRETKLDESCRGLLEKLPKADLHRHLGGCLDIAAQRRVGQAIWQASDRRDRQQALEKVGCWLKTGLWPDDWAEQLKQFPNRAQCCAALLTEASDAQLEHCLYTSTSPRIGLKRGHALGFAAYERPGELSGSALLAHPAALESYLQEIVDQAINERIAYLELRGSPQKYGDGMDFIARIAEILKRLKAVRAEEIPQIRFIVIADRRNSEDELEGVVRMTVQARRQFPELIAGLDLAGDEGTRNPRELSGKFQPAFENCVPLTIHAGEGESADSIWQAAYYLHADRIGHGLSIIDNPELAQRFRDRNICLELCPTSNREVIGYEDPEISESLGYEPYPLMKFCEQGLPLTLCTDNPGISRTTITCEFLRAARMTGGQLSLWNGLAILKQGFSHAFLPKQHKEPLIAQMDLQVYRVIHQQFSSAHS